MLHCAEDTRSWIWYARIFPLVRLHRRDFWVALCFVAAWHLMLPAAQAQRNLELQAKREAIEAIPFDQLGEEAHAKLWSVVSRPSLYRRMPPAVIPADPDLYVFLVRHPEVIVNMWDLMGITKVTINRNADYVFDTSDGAGTDSRVELIYGDPNLHVLYAEGSYQGALLKKMIRGRCVLVLRSDYAKAQDNNTYVTTRLDVFLQIDNVGAELIAKALHPLVGSTADKNFVESVKFVGQVTQAAETRPQRLQQLTQRLTKISPPVRQKFSALAAIANKRAQLHRTGQSLGASERQPRQDSTTVSRIYTLDDATPNVSANLRATAPLR